VYDSGEYSKRTSVSAIASASLRHSRAASVAIAVIPALSRPKTTRRCSVEVEL
jgi:hypothetical protein